VLGSNVDVCVCSSTQKFELDISSFRDGARGKRELPTLLTFFRRQGRIQGSERFPASAISEYRVF
jgi:hypothetical protein